MSFPPELPCMPTALPLLYSYRRCPYAMRARMALRQAGIVVQSIEIHLREKPAHLLEISPKATVPVLQLTDGTVLEQSLDIMYWALQQRDSENWLMAECAHLQKKATDLIAENDSSFKQALDRYKYPERYPEQPQLTYRANGECFLHKLENCLQGQGQLCQQGISFADIAIFPFIRQFAAVDSQWFATSPYPRLREWLAGHLASALFKDIMAK